MSTRMLIDARHTEETRVTVVKGSRVEEFDYESAAKRQLKGNIYLARVTRVEPSLQAAFVEYGGNRHGFLAFSEIHPDYYQIPVEDREQLIAAETSAAAETAEEVEDADHEEEAASEATAKSETEGDAEDQDEHEVLGSDEEEKDAEIEAAAERRRSLRAMKRKYHIQEVIKRRQVLLVQVVKEERGNKGAALTTYLSLAGRYCVLMPNSTHSGGISRKISSAADRKRLKKMIGALEVPDEMGLIIRTAGMERTKAEVKRDYEYLMRLWSGIRDLTLKSVAPALVYEEGNLIKRTIRDLYTRDIDEILVEGEAGYRAAKDFMKLLMPSHARKVQHYKDRIPLFHRYQVESHLEAMYQPVVQLRSGGYIVINPTEALISIDVNSGRATKEHNIEETALKTNMEAAEEIARQLRLRDMAGLVVIDFIDMEERNNNRSVERRMKEVLKSDRARIQVGRISGFGLMEMSRQRLRPNLIEASMESCATCGGTGVVRSVESAALMVLRQLEEEGIRGRSSTVRISANPEVAIYLLNKKRKVLSDLENDYEFTIEILATTEMGPSDIEVTREAASGGGRGDALLAETAVTPDGAPAPQAAAPAPAERPAEPAEASEGDEDKPRRKRRRRRRRRRGSGEEGALETAQETAANDEDEDTAAEESEDGKEAQSGEDGERRPRRRRGSRGGRRRREAAERRTEGAPETEAEAGEEASEAPAQEVAAEAAEPSEVKEEKPRRRRRRTKAEMAEAAEAAEAAASEEVKTEEPVKAEAEAETEAEAEEKPKRRRRTRKKAEPADAEATTVESEAAAPVEAAAEAEEAPAKPKRTRRTTKKTAEKASASTDAADEAPKKAADEKAETEKPVKRTRTRKPKAAAEEAAPQKDAVASEKAPEKAAPAAEKTAKAEAPAPKEKPVDKPVQSISVGMGDDAVAATAAAPEEDGDGPKRKGWWQRTFG
ncbi:Rne/Rng family ribonuclease [Kordiimonas marina]|uniref:Rne/Rng family ribonuclease n=1 Tax=Kordiimonas marina TaxID=2872312 RepID=UPI001FF25721|nr:ribonuclease E/G [Kordiimonas marina]MCJ9428966.1 ribonuclease E/G [Kordiimonas marina]